MITIALIGKIRGIRIRDGKSLSKIFRLISLSRNTIKKWPNVPQGATPKYRRRDVSTNLAPFIATLTQALEVDARCAKHERRTARALHVQLASQGYDGGHTRLTDFVRQWREKQGKFIGARAFVPLAFERGQALPIRLERGGPSGRRRLSTHAGLAHEAVRQPGVLARRLP